MALCGESSFETFYIILFLFSRLLLLLYVQTQAVKIFREDNTIEGI